MTFRSAPKKDPLTGYLWVAAGTSNPSWGKPTVGSPYGDDPTDQHWITEGWNDYKSGMYGSPGIPRGLGLVPLGARIYSEYMQTPLNYCSGAAQCW